MNFDYNEEQQLLADSVRRYLQKDYDFETRKKIVASPEGWSAKAWATFAEMGITGLPLSTDYGGFGGGAIDLMGVMEAFGEALAVEPYLPTLVAARLLAASRKSELLSAVGEGKLRLAFAHAEAGARHRLDHVKATAKKAGNGWTIDGEKKAVSGAPMAEKLVVSARVENADGGGIGLFLVDARDAQAKPFRMLDETRAADLILKGAKAEK